MPRVDFEPKISVFERAKTFHALDRAATAIGDSKLMLTYKQLQFSTHDPQRLISLSFPSRIHYYCDTYTVHDGIACISVVHIFWN
jgi:hypothetical protein